MQNLERLLNEYKNAPAIFQAGRYWKAYEDKIAQEIKKADLNQLRSGKYPIFGTFGFTESVYNYTVNMPFHTKLIKKVIRSLFITNKATLPYSLRLSDIREMAYNHCILQGQVAKAKSIAELEASTFGNPSDLFEMRGKNYTMQFLNFYIRFCYAQQYLNLQGDETIVELGSGAGFQVEILKKIYPKLTILCFDLPAPLYLCQEYLSKALGSDQMVTSDKTMDATDLNVVVQKGKVHMFGNWMFPLLSNYKIDIFWNSASFGEMEPEIVKNYLSYIRNNTKYVYLLQARKGKESSKSAGVVNPITFSDYITMLDGFKLVGEADAYEANRRMSQSGGYFQAAWKREIDE